MKLFLYSGFSESNPLDDILRKSINELQSKTLAVFLSNSDDFNSKYVYPIIEYFSNLGFIKISVCLYPKSDDEMELIASAHSDINFIAVEEAFNSDAIYLSGGNPYYFLNSLRKHQMLSRIVDFVAKGKILIGASAGSMIMQQDITNSVIPSYDLEPNPVGEMDLTAMQLVDFYFFPHYDGDQRFTEEVRMFADKKKKTCYICKDTNGLYVVDGELQLAGDVITIK